MEHRPCTVCRGSISRKMGDTPHTSALSCTHAHFYARPRGSLELPSRRASTNTLTEYTIFVDNGRWQMALKRPPRQLTNPLIPITNLFLISGGTHFCRKIPSTSFGLVVGTLPKLFCPPFPNILGLKFGILLQKWVLR
jgi:hypothetical protein